MSDITSDTAKNIVITNLTLSHLEAYKAIRLEALQMNPEAFGSSYEEEVNDHARFIARLEQASPTSFSLGCFEDDVLVGIVGFNQERSLKRLHIGGIYSMYITESARTKGYGKLLVAEVLKRVAELPEIEQIHLQVVSTNIPALKLYEHFKFRTYGVEKNALKIGDNYYYETYMALKLKT